MDVIILQNDIKPIINENGTNTICRACLADKNLQNLFTDEDLILKMFTSCTALEVTQNDDYPKYICDICIQELYKYYEFWNKCRSSLEKLDKLKNAEDSKPLIDEQDIKSDPDVIETPKPKKTKRKHKKNVVPENYIKQETSFEDDNINVSSIKAEDTNKLHKCTLCTKTYRSLLNLNLHMKKHTENSMESSLYLCQICGSVLSSSRTLLEHLESHSDVRKYICKTCGKSYKTRKTLHAHTLIHAEDKKHTCEHCGQKFRVNHSLRCHIKRCHSNLRPFVCTICSKAFKFSYKLTVHIRQHTGEKPFSCKQCNSSFACGSRLKIHMLKHTGIRNYSCTVCDKKFLQPQHLKTHMITHTGECKHKCNVCGKAFKYSQILKSHMKVHGDVDVDAEKCTDLS